MRTESSFIKDISAHRNGIGVQIGSKRYLYSATQQEFHAFINAESKGKYFQKLREEKNMGNYG